MFKIFDNSPSTQTDFVRLIGGKDYELKDHLGNVRVVISDTKLIDDADANGLVTSSDDVTPEIRNYTDYYAFGMAMPGRLYNGGEYRYGFNGKENINEINGIGNSLDFGARVFDARVGRFQSVDMLSAESPMQNPYHFCSNIPISKVDIDGNWDIEVHVYSDRKKFGYGILVVKDNQGNEVYRTVVRVHGLKKQQGGDRSKANGDTPLGVYKISGWRATGDSKEDRIKFGPNDRIDTKIQSGEGYGKRDAIQVHGGHQEIYDKKTDSWQKLKGATLWNTRGCMRIKDDELIEIKKITDELEAKNAAEKPGTLKVIDNLFIMNGMYYSGSDARELLILAEENQKAINSAREALGDTNPYQVKAAGPNPAPSDKTMDAIDNFFKVLWDATSTMNAASTKFEEKGIPDKKY